MGGLLSALGFISLLHAASNGKKLKENLGRVFFGFVLIGLGDLGEYRTLGTHQLWIHAGFWVGVCGLGLFLFTLLPVIDNRVIQNRRGLVMLSAGLVLIGGLFLSEPWRLL